MTMMPEETGSVELWTDAAAIATAPEARMSPLSLRAVSESMAKDTGPPQMMTTENANHAASLHSSNAEDRYQKSYFDCCSERSKTAGRTAPTK